MVRSETTTGSELEPVKFSRLTRRGILLGLSLSQLIALGIGGASLIAAFYAGGGILLAYSAPIWMLAARGVGAGRRVVAVAHHGRATAVPTPRRRPQACGHASASRGHGEAA